MSQQAPHKTEMNAHGPEWGIWKGLHVHGLRSEAERHPVLDDRSDRLTWCTPATAAPREAEAGGSQARCSPGQLRDPVS